MKRRLLSILIFAGGLAPLRVNAMPETALSGSIEKEVLRISIQLKPIPDDIWNTIAGTRAAEKYKIVAGDTLYDISNRFFGDPKYWPKIWSLNNSSITNPHLILPGNLIAFMPGSGTSLPSISVTPVAIQEGAPQPVSTHHSREWDQLPQQKWENISMANPEGLEQVGLGQDTKEKLKMMSSSVSFSLKSFAASVPITPLAEIFASTKPTHYLSIGDKALIHSSKERLQIGQTYTATAPTPSLLLPHRKDIQGYSYRLMGNILIMEEKDGIFIGKVLSADHLISRGNVLIPPPARIPILEPVLGPKSMKAEILMDPEYSTAIAAQHKQIFLDRGSEDGLTQGMVFNVYQYEDPLTELTFSKEPIDKIAEIMILQVSERFSAAMIIKSLTPISQGMTAILTSDEKIVKETQPLVPVDELDKVDENDDLNRKEKRELRQLEKWKENPPSPLPSQER